jgi:hypothetical protein
MRDVLRRLVASRANLGLALGIAAAYLALFLVAVADLTIDGAARSASLFLVAGWENLVFRQQAPFQFEAVAIAEAPGLIWLVSPMNVLIGLALGCAERRWLWRARSRNRILVAPRSRSPASM